LPRAATTTIALGASAALAVVAARAIAAGTATRLISGPLFLVPFAVFGMVGSWLIASAVVNALRIYAALSIVLRGAGIHS
jgi:hypothetical protein